METIQSIVSGNKKEKIRFAFELPSPQQIRDSALSNVMTTFKARFAVFVDQAKLPGAQGRPQPVEDMSIRLFHPPKLKEVASCLSQGRRFLRDGEGPKVIVLRMRTRFHPTKARGQFPVQALKFLADDTDGAHVGTRAATGPPLMRPPGGQDAPGIGKEPPQEQICPQHPPEGGDPRIS